MVLEENPLLINIEHNSVPIVLDVNEKWVFL